MFTIKALYIIADIAMILVWSYFAYQRRPHNSIRTMLMLILGIVAIMLEVFPGIEHQGKSTAGFLLIGGALHYFSVRKGKDIPCLLAHLAIILPIAVLPYVWKESKYDKLVKSFKYSNEKSLSNLIDASILPPFELDTVYLESMHSEPRFITGRFHFLTPFDETQYQENVILLKQLYQRHMHKTHTSNGEPIYLASEAEETSSGRKYTAASIDFHDSGFCVTYGEYTDQLDPANIQFLKQITGELPTYSSIYRFSNYEWNRTHGEEIILLDIPLQEDDLMRIQVSCSGRDDWKMSQRNDTTFLMTTKSINKKTLQTTRFTLIPDQMGGCEAIHVENLRETISL